MFHTQISVFFKFSIRKYINFGWMKINMDFTCLSFILICIGLQWPIYFFVGCFFVCVRLLVRYVWKWKPEWWTNTHFETMCISHNFISTICPWDLSVEVKTRLSYWLNLFFKWNSLNEIEKLIPFVTCKNYAFGIDAVISSNISIVF